MKNTERTWERTRWRIDHHLDYVLALPPGLYVYGLFTSDAELLVSAVVMWLFAVLIWTPWIIIRVAMNGPPGDPARATAVLGLGLLPFAAYPFFDWPVGPVGLRVYSPILLLMGVAAMACAALHWPRSLTAGARRAVLIVGGLAWGFVAVLLLGALAMGLAEVEGFLIAPIFLVGALAAVAAGSVFYAAARPPPRPPRNA